MNLQTFWQYEPQQIFYQLKTSPEGLSSQEAVKRLKERSAHKKKRSALIKNAILLINQFKSPLVLLLVAAVILAAFLGETSDVFIISCVTLLYVLFAYQQNFVFIVIKEISWSNIKNKDEKIK
jgi:Mg2+-importing ATPase